MTDQPESSLSSKAPLHMGPALWCAACGFGVFVDVAESSSAYFAGVPVPCSHCGADIDLLEALDHQIEDNFALTWAYAALGAVTSVNSFQLAPGGIARVRFSDWGIPEQATILSVNYTGIGTNCCFPTELHGNTPPWAAPTPAHEFLVYGRDPAGTATTTHVNCSVIWFCPPDEDDGWEHLLESFRYFAAGRRERAIVPAHIAVECALAKAIAEGLRKAKVPGSRDLGAFARQSSVLLPLLADRFACCRLSVEVSSRLKLLRQRRNEIAHSGSSSHPLGSAAVARLLAAATLGFHYGRFLRKQIESTGA